MFENKPIKQQNNDDPMIMPDYIFTYRHVEDCFFLRASLRFAWRGK